MRWIIGAFLTVTFVIDSTNCAVKNEIGVLRASGDIAHSLLELLASGRVNVDENQSHLTALRARLQDRPQHSSISKFNGNVLNRIASNIDDITEIHSDQVQSMSSTASPKNSDELNFIEDTDEHNFVTEPYPPKAKSRQWMIHRMDPFRTTTTSAPSTTQFTLFPTFPTLFPPLFGAITPMNPFALPQISTPGPIFNLPTTTVPTTTTQKAIERSKEPTDNSVDKDLLKPYGPEPKISNRRSKIVGSRLQFKLGEKMNKQEGDEEPSEQSTIPTEKPDTDTAQSKGPDEETNNTTGQQEGTTKKPDGDEETTQPSTNSGINSSTDDNKTTQKPNSGKNPEEETGSGNTDGSGRKPNEESGIPPKSSGSGSGANNDDASGSGSGKSSGNGDESLGSGACTDGKWSEWKMKFPCSAECGACGTRQKERECLSFKNGKGCPCTGDYKIIEPCNIEVCRYPKPSCCPPYDLIHVDGVFACGPQEKQIMAEFKNSTTFRKH